MIDVSTKEPAEVTDPRDVPGADVVYYDMRDCHAKLKQKSARSDLENLFCKLYDNVETLDKFLADWAGKFLENPSYHMEYGLSALINTAQREVQYQVRNMVYSRFVDEDETRSHAELYALVENYIKDEVLKRAQHVAASTNTMSNLMDEHRRVAWARLYADFHIYYI